METGRRRLVRWPGRLFASPLSRVLAPDLSITRPFYSAKATEGGSEATMNITRIRSGKAISLFLLLILTLKFTGPASQASADAQPQAMQTIDLATTATDVLVTGAATGAHLGQAGGFATGDFNGDMIPDLAVAAPDSDVTVSATDSRPGAGAVYVIFGRASFPAIIDGHPAALNQPDVRLIGGRKGMEGSPGGGDQLGFSLAASDVNGDGRSDLLIGAPGADFPGGVDPARADTGALFIVFGAHLTTGETIDLADGAQASCAIYGASTGDRFGSAIASANVGGPPAASPAQQMISDIFVGAPLSGGEDGTRTAAGAAYLIFGSSTLGSPKSVDLGNTPAHAIVYGPTGSRLGTSVDAGDIDANGIGDLVAGAPDAGRPAAGMITPAAAAGAIYGVFGGSNLARPGAPTPVVFEVDSSDPATRSPQNISVYGANADDHFGHSAFVADVTGDGVEDLLAGSPDADGPNDARNTAGEAYVFHGGAGFAPPVGATGRRLDVAAGHQSLTVYGSAAGDRAGSSVGAGLYTLPGNIDRVKDLLLGSPGALGARGSVSILFGGASLDVTATRDLSLGQDDVRVTGQAAGDQLGRAFITANLDNRDGGDLVLGSPLGDTVSRPDAGKAYVLLSTTMFENLPPAVSITAQPPSGAAPLSVSFTSTAADRDGTIVSYAWEFGDGSTSSAASPSHQYAAAGSFTARLTVTDNRGGTAEAQTTVTVSAPPANQPPTLTINATPTSGMAPLTVNFISSAADPDGSIASYAWAFGDGSTSVEVSPSHTYTSAGNFTATLTVTDNQGATTTRSLAISASGPQPNQNPTVDITATPSSGAPPLAVSFTASATDPDGTIVSYAWDFGDGGSATQPLVSHTYVSAGTYLVRVTVTDNRGGTASDQLTVTVSQPAIRLQLVTPSGAGRMVWGQAVTINWEVPVEDRAFVRGFDLHLSTDGGNSFTVAIASNPTPPAIGANTFSFNWQVPALCVEQARVLIVATGLNGERASAGSAASFSISDRGPTLNLSDMRLADGGNKLSLKILEGPTEVRFEEGIRVEISTDQTGSSFEEFEKVKIKKNGKVLQTKGNVGGTKLKNLFPDGSIRILRIINPVCGVTEVRVLRNGKELVLLAAGGFDFQGSTQLSGIIELPGPTGWLSSEKDAIKRVVYGRPVFRLSDI